MDKQRVYICIAIILFIALVGAVVYNYYEIYPQERFISPSREVFANDFYALDQWLRQTGHNVRIERHYFQGMFEGINEKVVMINSNSLFWFDPQELISWIEQGGFLIINLSWHTEGNFHLYEFLSNLGIIVEYNLETFTETETETETEDEDLIPHFQQRISFLIERADNISYINDANGIVRLVEIFIGKGALTVVGTPFFMFNFNIKREVNADLAWKLTAGRFFGESDENNKGILFIREHGRTQPSMLGAIIQRGNLVPIFVSSILLILVGFWSLIPVFGLVSKEKQRTSRPIKDRFNAEIRFLKKYRSLDHYLHVYEREKKIKPAENKNSYNYRDLIDQYRRIHDGTTKF